MPFGWEGLPWHVLNPPSLVELPTFYLAEISSILLCCLAITHALLRGNMAHKKLAACAFLGGVGNDVFFTWLPLVDNFFHSQAYAMASPRIPLYILTYYLGWMYFPTALAWALRLSPTAEACAAGLLCALFYWPWDMTGAKHLWWTWHTTDQGLEYRYMGVPLASTHWTIIFCTVWARLLRHTVGYRDATPTEKARDSFLKSCAIIITTSVPAMMVTFGAVNSLVTCTPGIAQPGTPRALTVTICVLFAVVWCDLMDRLQPGKKTAAAAAIAADGNEDADPAATAVAESPSALRDSVGVAEVLFFLAGISAHLGMTYYVAVNGDSAAHVSTGIHQTFGPCGVEAVDICGLRRHEYVCAETHAAFEGAAWSLDCPHVPADRYVAPEDGERWYTICGTPKSEEWLATVPRHTAAAWAGFVAVVAVALRRVTTEPTKSAD